MNSYETTFDIKLRNHIAEQMRIASENIWLFPHDNHGDYMQQVGALQACKGILDEMDAIRSDIDKGR